MSDLISAILAFALILIPAIIIHELGHFFAAKLVGISVLEFGVGFPPRVLKLFRWGETDFTLNLLPIGGFVRPFGEDLIGPSNTEEELAEGEKRKNEVNPEYLSERDELIARGVPPEKIRSVMDVKPLPRIFFMAAGALANFATAIVLFTIIALIGLPQEIGARVQIAELPATSVYTKAGVEVGDAIELVNGNLFKSHYEFLDLLQAAQGSVTLTMRRITTNENYTINITPAVSHVAGQIFITAVVDGTPGSEAGLKPADVILAIEGVPFPSNADPIQVIQQKTVEFAGHPLDLTVLRDGNQFPVTLTPRVNPPKGQGRIGLGITAQYMTNDGVVYVPSVPQTTLIPQSVGTSIQYGFQRTGDTLGIILSLPVKLIQGVISPEEARPVSIVGISRVGGQILKQSINQGSPTPILEFIALVSIFLGFSNLLPIPALDGGRILFALIELVRGKPVPLHIESRIHLFGFMILLLLGLIVIVYDIFNPLVLR